MKVAYLVGFCPMTRVVVEVANPEKLTQAEVDTLIAKAREQILENANEKLNEENADEIRIDNECPYGTIYTDNEESNECN